MVIGGSRYVGRQIADDPYRLRDGLTGETAVVAVGVDGRLAGIIVLVDPLRPDAAQVLAALRRAGIDRIVLASGDRQGVVDALAAELPLDGARGDLSPTDKVALVHNAAADGPTMMIGDGVNDAPALAAATIGIAMGARGSVASAQVADVVLLVDRLDRVATAVEIAHRTRRIALQSVVGGLALSVVGMIVAAFGYLPPVAGALTQEAIDIAVILNAAGAALNAVKAPPRGAAPVEITAGSAHADRRDDVVAAPAEIADCGRRQRAPRKSLCSQTCASAPPRTRIEEIRSFHEPSARRRSPGRAQKLAPP